MAATKRTPIQVQQDRQRIAEMYLQGRTQQVIASKFGMTQQMVSYDLAAIRRTWQASAVRDYGESIAVELARLEELERQSWEAWERSKQPRRREVQKQVAGPTDDTRTSRYEVMIVTEDGLGNPAYLEVIGRCIDRRIKLLGLDNYAEQRPDSQDAFKVYIGVDVGAI